MSRVRALADLRFNRDDGDDLVIPKGTELDTVEKTYDEIAKQEDPHERHLLYHRLEKRKDADRDSVWVRWAGAIRCLRIGREVERLTAAGATLPANTAGSLPRGAPSWAKVRA